MKVEVKSLKKEEKEGSKLKGYAEIVIDNNIAIHNIKIIQGKEKLFIAMPSIKKEDKYFDIVHPINNETREIIETAILNEFTRE